MARILLRPPAELATTDISSHALAALEESSIRFSVLPFGTNYFGLVGSQLYLFCMHKYFCRKVYLVGRRGPVQAACTAKELREVLGNS